MTLASRTASLTIMPLLCGLLLHLAGSTPAVADPVDLEERVAALEAQLAERSAQGDPLQVYWDDGVRVKSRDGKSKVRFGGRLMVDVLWFSDDSTGFREAFGKPESGAELRRARFYMSGTLYEAVDFKLQFDWAGSETALKDAYLALRETPVGRLKVGHFYEPYSLAAQTSSKYYTFMELSPSVNAFSPVRNDGVQLSSALLDDRMTWAAGAFWVADSQGKVENENLYAFTGRLTGLPMSNEDGTRLVHLGAAASYRNLDGLLRFTARPSLRRTDQAVDTRVVTIDPDTGAESTSDIVADSAWVYGLEAATVLGAFHAESELTGSRADLQDGNNYDAYGWYVQAGYFLTGEHRPYSRHTSRFGKLKPKRNFGHGGGAWEVAARYSYLDLTDGVIEGGEIDDWTAGINWYLNPAVRVMFNYVYSDVQNAGDVHLLGSRFQVAF